MLDQIITAAIAAGEIMLEAENEDKEVQEKEGSANFVTKYDVAVQNFLQGELNKIMPEAGFLGEEEGAGEADDASWQFIVDPIDGTTNFIHQYRHSCVSIALAKDKVVQYGVVYNPYTQEVFSAQRGVGVWRNGKPIHVSDRPLREGLVCFGTAPYNVELANISFKLAKALFDRAADIRRSGSAALDMCAIASGWCEFNFEMVLQPWDFAAVSLILEEAGGKIIRPDGSPLDLYKPNPVVAGNAVCYQEYFEQGLGKIPGGME